MQPLLIRVNIMSSDLIKLGGALEALDSSSTPAQLAEGITIAESVISKVSEALKTLKSEYEEQMIRILKDVPEIEANGNLYYLGQKKTNRQASNFDVLVAVLEKAEGDTERIVDCLKKGSFKPATTKKLLGETNLFWVDIDDKVECKPVKIPSKLLEDKK